MPVTQIIKIFTPLLILAEEKFTHAIQAKTVSNDDQVAGVLGFNHFHKVHWPSPVCFLNRMAMFEI